MATRLPIERAREIIEAGLPIGPRMYPCVCGAGRHAHAGGNSTGACPETGCKRYRANQAWELAYRAIDAQATSLGHSLREADNRDRDKHRKANPRGEGEWSISASDTATCPRKIQYRNSPPEGFEPAPEDKRPARMGTIIHEEATRRLRLLYPWRLFKGKVRIAGLDRESEYDSYDPLTGEVEDIKTAGDWRWDTLADEGPEEDVWEQVFLYGLALEDEGHVVKTIKLSYLKRCNGHDEPFVRPYDRKIAERARDRLMGYATSLDLGLDLPKTGKGPTLDGLCRGCFARNDCWSIPKAEQAGRSPESYVNLGAEPIDDDIIWAIGERVAASAETREAKQHVDEAKVNLDGIDPGRYGPYEGYSRKVANSGQPDWKADALHLRENFDLPDEQRPHADDIPVPHTDQQYYVQWGKVRKATLDRERREAAKIDEEAS